MQTTYYFPPSKIYKIFLKKESYFPVYLLLLLSPLRVTFGLEKMQFQSINRPFTDHE